MDDRQLLADVQLLLSVARQTLEIGLDAKSLIVDAERALRDDEPLPEDQRYALQGRNAALRNQIDADATADDAAG